MDDEKLLAEDYDLHHYDWYGGFLRREDDAASASKAGGVAVHHFWADEGKRKAVMEKLVSFAEGSKKGAVFVQSAGVLKACTELTLTSLWLRSVARRHNSPPLDLARHGLHAEELSLLTLQYTGPRVWRILKS